MTKRSHVPVPILVLIVFFPVVLPVHATVYNAGVTVGQSASYAPVNVTYHGTSYYRPVPQWIKDLNATAQFTGTIQHFYTSTNVTVQSVSEYKNSTSKTVSYNGDLMTGLGNLTFGLIAGGLISGDALWNALYTPTINQTITETVLGVSRTVNVWNNTYKLPISTGYAVFSQEYVWDQISGINLESKHLNIYPTTPDGGYVVYTDVRIQSTNIFSNPTSPGFTVTSSNPASVTRGTSATSTITITAVNGFSGTVALTDMVPSGLTCLAISPSSLLGYGTASLTCNSTTPGTYTVTITATSGSTTHTSTTTMTVTAAPSQTPNAPATILGLAPTTFYTIIGVVILAIAATGAYLVLRTKREKQGKVTTSTIPT